MNSVTTARVLLASAFAVLTVVAAAASYAALGPQGSNNAGAVSNTPVIGVPANDGPTIDPVGQAALPAETVEPIYVYPDGSLAPAPSSQAAPRSVEHFDDDDDEREGRHDDDEDGRYEYLLFGDDERDHDDDDDHGDDHDDDDHEGRDDDD